LWAFDVMAGNRNIFEAESDDLAGFAFRPDGRLFTSVSRDGHTRLWDTLWPIELGLAQEGHALRFSRDGRALAYARPDGVGIWRVTDPAPIYRRLLREMDATLGRFATFTPDSSALVVLDESGESLAHWDILSDALTTQFVGSHVLRNIAFVPDSTRMLTLGAEGLGEWQTTGGANHSARYTLQNILLKTDPAPMNMGPFMFFTANGRQIAFRVGGEANHAVLLDLSAPQNVRTFHSTGEIQSLSLSPDGKQLAVGTMKIDGTRILDTANFSVIRTLGPARANVLFSPDGRWLANYTARQCELWNVRTWKLAKTFARSTTESEPGQMAFSPDGKLLWIAKSSRVWELVNSATLDTLAIFELAPGPGGGNATFSPNGEFVAFFGHSAVHVYHLPSLRAELRKMNLDW
jgi:WD40 repeat protein